MFILSIIVLLLVVKDGISKFTTADYLDSLDHLICGQINEPSVEDCDKLYDHLDRYYDCLQGLLESLREKDPLVGEAIAHYWALGKPGFTQDYDVCVYQKLENIMRATDREMNAFFDRVERIKALWEQFREECEKNKYYCEPSPTECYYKYSKADYLDSLDYIICSQITEPTVEYCEKLFDHLDKYYDGLQDLLENLREKNPEAGEAIANYWALGKPKFTQDYDVPIFQTLEEVLEKSQQSKSEFYQKVEKIKALWEDFKDECEKNKYFCEPSPILYKR